MRDLPERLREELSQLALHPQLLHRVHRQLVGDQLDLPLLPAALRVCVRPQREESGEGEPGSQCANIQGGDPEVLGLLGGYRRGAHADLHRVPQHIHPQAVPHQGGEQTQGVEV